MSAPMNMAETMPIVEPILSDEEVVNLSALAQQLMNAGKEHEDRAEEKGLGGTGEKG